MELDKEISVCIQTSPLLSHPDTPVIDGCYFSIRHHLPTCHVYILIDGMRGEDIQWYEKYEAYKVEMRRRVKEDPAWKNVTLVEAPEFLHQAGQLRAFINSDICTTPNILSIEQDSYLVADSIEWESLVLCLNEKLVSAIRMALEPEGYPVGKEHLYRGEIFAHGVKLLYITEPLSLCSIGRMDYWKYIVSQFITARCNWDWDGSGTIHSTLRDYFDKYKNAVYFAYPYTTYGCTRVIHTDARRQESGFVEKNHGDSKFPMEF